MSERSNKFTDELIELVNLGGKLLNAIQKEFFPVEFEEQCIESFGGNEEEMSAFLEALPNFKIEYQAWYSKAQAVVKQILPDRFSDFVAYYEYPRVRKEVSFQNYMVKDYLQGLSITNNYSGEVKVDGRAAIPEFVQQLNLVKAARDLLDSTLLDLKSIVQADVYDSEIASAGALANSGYLRGAGAICGVVLEKHLRHICERHSVVVRKKNPGISDLNNLLKERAVTTIPQWRFIQHLADIRNICDHAKEREPSKEELDDLVSGTEKILKTVF
ncbi:MAG: hypothetical protein NXH70_08280 [Hyphomonas sp.]|nr:hypothetical protein [Hyphomonas sp.]